MKPLLERIAIDQEKFKTFLDLTGLSATAFFNSLYGSKNGHYLMKQMQSGEKIVSINKYKEFQGRCFAIYNIIPDLLKISPK